MLTRGAWLYGSAAVVVCLLAAPVLAGATVTVTGDRSAYDEVLAAFKKLFSLPGFRAKSANPQAQGVFEYAAPNSWHFGSPQASYEQIHVNGQIATRMNLPGQPSGWRCRPAKGDRPFWDPTRATGTHNVSVSRGPDTVIEGTPVHTILWKEGDKSRTYYVGSQNGLPKRMMPDDRNAIDYYDYGAHITITLPPACASQ